MPERQRLQRVSDVLKMRIQAVLRDAERPVTRNALTAQIRSHLDMVYGVTWSLATVAREVRRAIAELERDGVPIVSDGTGFRVATTLEERSAAALRLERMAVSCLRRATSIRRLTLGQEARQLGLFEEVGDDGVRGGRAAGPGGAGSA